MMMMIRATTYWVTGIMPNALQGMFLRKVSRSLSNSLTVGPTTPILEKEPEAHNGKVTWLRSHSQSVKKLTQKFELSTLWYMKGFWVMKKFLGTISSVENMNFWVLLKCCTPGHFQHPQQPPSRCSSPPCCNFDSLSPSDTTSSWRSGLSDPSQDPSVHRSDFHLHPCFWNMGSPASLFFSFLKTFSSKF